MKPKPITHILRALPLHPVAVETPFDYSARFEAMRQLLRRKGKTDSIGESPKDRPEKDWGRYERLPKIVWNVGAGEPSASTLFFANADNMGKRS